MTETNSSRLFPKKRIRPYRGRGEVYAWLRAHHRRVSELSVSWAWADLVREMLRDGLQGRDGVTPTPKAVTKVWQRVRRDLEADARAVGPRRPGAKYPSRISPTWRPQVAASQPVLRATALVAHRAPATAVAPAGGQAHRLVPRPPPNIEPTDFPTTDPSGAPLAEGYVWYDGEPTTRDAAERLETMHREAREIDRFK